ncbi:MAG: M13 family peptidase, partial [Flavobacterium sp.]
MKMQFNKKFLFVIPVIIGFTPCNAQKGPAPKEPGINVSYMDKSVKPGNDFFRFVNGTWYDKTEIPSDKTRWGSFDELRQKTDTDALAILKEA